MGMGTLCTSKKAPIYGHWDTLHCQKGPQMWAWGHIFLYLSGSLRVRGLTSMYTSRRTDRRPPLRFVPLTPCRGRRSR